ncbi:MAG: hypothetical protein WKG32_03485 [Gemmatimonadaceae bacterium]
MKTAISLPDGLFESAEALARRLGVSRSELYATALAQFVAHHDRAVVTERLNAVYAAASGEALDRDLASLHALQARSLPRDAWSW